VEPNREIVEDLMRRYGYEEEEAEIAHHLREARNLLFELLRAEAEAEAWNLPEVIRGDVHTELCTSPLHCPEQLAGHKGAGAAISRRLGLSPPARRKKDS
jgi:hypothetical protein